MKRYTRDNFLFQIERDKGVKIKTQLLDTEFFNLAEYMDSTLKYVKTIEIGGFVGKYGFENCLFKNVGNQVILERSSGFALKYTFLDYTNSIFIYNSNFSNVVYNLAKSNIEHQVLKYKNNIFEFGKITDEIKLNSINATEKIKESSLEIKKIHLREGWYFGSSNPKYLRKLFLSKMLFRERAITKCIVSQHTMQRTLDSGIMEIINPLSEITPAKITNCYAKGVIGNSAAYYRDNGFNIQKRWEQFFTTPASLQRRFDYQEVSRSLVYREERVTPFDIVKEKSVTSLGFIKNKNPRDIEPNDSGSFFFGTNTTPATLVPLSLLEYYLSGLFFGAKEIKNRHLDKTNNSLFFVGNNGNWFISHGAATKSKIYIRPYGRGYGSGESMNSGYSLVPQPHIASNCFESRHFSDNSISIMGDSYLTPHGVGIPNRDRENGYHIPNHKGLPINKFSAAFLTMLGL